MICICLQCTRVFKPKYETGDIIGKQRCPNCGSFEICFSVNLKKEE